MGLKKLLEKAEGLQQELESFEVKFIREYNDTLLGDEQSHRQDVPTSYYRPSSLGGCMRMLYAMRTGVPQEENNTKDEWTYNIIGICDSGTDRHKRIQDIVAKMPNVKMLDLEELVKEAKQQGIDTEFMGWNSDRTEARCKNENYKIFFQPDGALNFLGKEALLEIKTESIYSFRNRIEPKEEHLVQATAYALGLGMRYVLFFYEDRNFTTHKLFLVEITDAMKQGVIEKINTVESHIAQGTVPPKEDDKCKYCRYKAWCKAVGVGGQQNTTEV